VIGLSGGSGGVSDPNWGGCNIYISQDNQTYVKWGTQTGPTRQGVLTSALAAYNGANPDTTNTLAVSLIESSGELDTVTTSDAQAARSLCVIVDPDGTFELLSYVTATLTAQNAYNVTTLYRGFYGTRPCAHPSGAQFLRLDPYVFQTPLQPQYIGHTLYAKFASVNIFNLAEQSLTDCTAYTYVPTGPGVDPLTNPIWQAMLANQTLDLGYTDQPVLYTIDLNQGGSGTCAPVLGSADLGFV